MLTNFVRSIASESVITKCDGGMKFVVMYDR